MTYLLEGKAQDGNLLAGDGVEHGLDHALNKPLLLIIVDRHHLQSKGIFGCGKIEDV